MIAWHGTTLKKLQQIPDLEGELFQLVLSRLEEYVGLCVEWERILLPPELFVEGEDTAVTGRRAVREGLRLVLAAAVRTKTSDEVSRSICDPESPILKQFYVLLR